MKSGHLNFIIPWVPDESLFPRATRKVELTTKVPRMKQNKHCDPIIMVCELKGLQLFID